MLGCKDPQDKVFMTREEIGDIEPDPSVGAVLCGMDINLSMGGFVLLDQKLKEVMQTIGNFAKLSLIFGITRIVISSSRTRTRPTRPPARSGQVLEPCLLR